MPEESSLVRCPLCDGHGALAPRAIVDRFVNPDLRHRLDARIAEIAELCSAQTTQTKGLDFQKEVHTWNPVPIWRRSPKE